MSLIPARSVLSAALCPEQVGLVWRVGRTTSEQRLLCKVSELARPWHAALNTLHEGLNTPGKPERVRVSVILSSRFVRYALVPWSAVPLRAEEASAWDRMHLEQAYGDLAGWKVVCASGAFGRARVACAVPQDLLDRLQETLASKRHALQSVVPSFVLAWNHWRGRLTAGELFGVAESGRLVMGRYGRTGWDSLRMLACASTGESLAAAARRELSLQEGLGNGRVLMFAPGIRAGEGPFDPSVEWVGLDAADEGPALAMARGLAQA